MQANPRVGLILMRGDWFERAEARQVIGTIRQDSQAIVNYLKAKFEVKGPWVVDSADSLVACQHAIREAEVDMVLLAFQTWGEDARLVSLLQSIGTHPLVVWCYMPWRRTPRPTSFHEVLRGSGPVGTFGAMGTLRNLGVPFLFAYGAPDDPRLMDDLTVAAHAAQVRQALRSARFGLLPSRNDQMQATFVDEFRLMADFGPTVQYVSVSEFRRVVDSLPEEQIEAYLALLNERFQICNVADETLKHAAQAQLGLARLAVEYRLDVLSVNDISPELHRAFQMRPALYPDLLNPIPALFQPEGDLGAATANYILHHLTGSPTMFLEFWLWDDAKNQIIGGHAGLQNPALADQGEVEITPDYEYNQSNETEGAQFQFMAKQGRVTVFQLRSTPKGWQAIGLSGICLERQPGVEGYPHAVIRLDAPIDYFLNRVSAVGATQHWVMAYGSVLPELEAFCQIANIPLEKITH